MDSQTDKFDSLCDAGYSKEHKRIILVLLLTPILSIVIVLGLLHYLQFTEENNYNKVTHFNEIVDDIYPISGLSFSESPIFCIEGKAIVKFEGSNSDYYGVKLNKALGKRFSDKKNEIRTIIVVKESECLAGQYLPKHASHMPGLVGESALSFIWEIEVIDLERKLIFGKKSFKGSSPDKKISKEYDKNGNLVEQQGSSEGDKPFLYAKQYIKDIPDCH